MSYKPKFGHVVLGAILAYVLVFTLMFWAISTIDVNAVAYELGTLAESFKAGAA